MYSKLQKFISFFLIFFLLASFSFRIPFIGFLSYTFAQETPFYNLVSIIVQEDIYENIKGDIDRYSKDIQGVLEGTKVVVLPTPKNTSSFNIASLNEGLYFEGLKSIKPSTNFESKLIGTVLIGELPIPIVFNRDNSLKSIVPYTDFTDKLYIWDNESSKYSLSEDNNDGLSAEIWHGVITPNKGNKGADILAIKDFFSKNHDFYEGTGNFKTSVGILNGDNSEGIPANYEPFVFYFDQIRESEAVIYDNYIGYNQYLANKEDLVYNRFSNDLANKLQDGILSNSNKTILEMVKDLDPTFDASKMSNGLDLSKTPDIQSRHVIDTYTKQMVEIFNGATLGEFKKNVHNAGRYNKTEKKVNVDIPSFLISTLDTVNTEIVKSTNNDLEEVIDNLVKGGLSRKIAIPTEKREIYNYNYDYDDIWVLNGSGVLEYSHTTHKTDKCDKTYTNFLYGRQASHITTAPNCTIYRGSTEAGGTLVEANRGLNTKLTKGDASLCATKLTITGGKVTGGITGYWGGNTPLNLAGYTTSKLNIGPHDLKGGIVPVFDIKGSKKVTNSSLVPDPRDCFNNNYLLTFKESEDTDTGCYTSYRVPINGQSAVNWTCRTTNQKHNYPKSFNSNYAFPSGKIYLDGALVKNKFFAWNAIEYRYYYKKIKSYIFHKSPTANELGNEVNAMVPPALPIDKNRYVDFVGARGNYARIDYPQLLRVTNTTEDLDLATIKQVIKTYLDQRSLQVNNVINASNPSALGGTSLSIYNLLKNGAFPANNIDFYNYLDSKPDKDYTIAGETKTANYIDSLAFAIYWNNLTSIAAKYKFIFENYLSDEIGGSPYDFHLVKNKKLYEIAYLGAPGDAQNMYVKLDPEAKSENPYPEVISDNSLINNQLLASNVANTYSNTGLDGGNNVAGNSTSSTNFNCAPPEGVPIYEWFPAVVCRLGDLLPPKISISDGSCGVGFLGGDDKWEYGGIGTSESFFTKEEKEEILLCKGDVNKNGVNDCIESKLETGSLELTSDSNKYYYNKYGKLKTEILDKDGKVVKLDSNTYINFIIDKIEIPKDSTIEFNEVNKKVIYDSTNLNEGSKKEANKYVLFTEKEIRAKAGTASYSFSSKNKDSNVYFKTVINLKDNNGNIIKTINSTPLLIKIRGDKLFLNSSKISNGVLEVDNLGYSSKVSNSINLFLTNENKQQLSIIHPLVDLSSPAKEKIILNIENISKDENKLDINYPLKLRIKKDGVQIQEETTINEADLASFEGILAIKESGTYNIEIIDNEGLKVTKQIDFTPDIPFELDVQLGTTIIENEGNITTNLVTIFDQYGNIVSGEYLSMDININGNLLEFEENSSNSISYKMFEGYKAFRLQSTSSEVDSINKITFYLKDADENIILTKSVDVRTLSDIKLDISDPSVNIKVGGEKAKFSIEVKDSGGNLLSNFNSRAYLVVPPIYGQATTPYVEIKSGKAEVEFITSIVAGKNIPIEFQVEGLNHIYTKKITIYPEAPIKVDLALSQNKIEASLLKSSFLSVDLKDRFGNIVFNDNTTKISFEILPEYKGIITTPTKTKTLSEGKTDYYIYGTDLPGQAFFKVSTNPDISSNSFEVAGQGTFDISKLTAIGGMINAGSLTAIGAKLFKEVSGKYMSIIGTKDLLLTNSTFLSLNPLQKNQVLTLWDDNNSITVSGVGENIGKIETFYFWNQSKINNTKYNSLYTTLIGAPYGDVTEKDYLAGGLIFDKNNRSLAVTTLLNNTFKYEDVITVLPEGGVKSVYSTSILTQDISYNVSFDDKKLYLGLFNESLNTFIGKILFNFDNNISLKSCIGNSRDFNDCSIDNEKTFILLKSLDPDYTTYLNNGKLVIKNQYGQILLEINDDGEIERKGSISIELNKKDTNKYSVFDIKSGNKIIGIMGFKFADGKIVFSRDEAQFNANKIASTNSILGLVTTTSYGTRDIVGTDGTIKSIYYNDPFSDKKTLNDFSNENEDAYENFINKAGLGWEGGNKTLLAFAAGSSVGEATKDNISFSLINIGDPVVSLKKIRKKLPGTLIDRNFDATIGTLMNKDYNIIGYKVFDYNNDNKDDILLINRDNSFGLLENKNIHGNFLNKGDVVFISDLGDKDLVQVGDFSGDGFEDIFFVNKHGKPFLLKNTEKDFIRIPLEDVFNLSGNIIISEAFDMDNDGLDDIITLDDFGEINIFYGAASYNFDKKTIGDGYGIELDNTSRDDGALIYFNGLYQLDQTGISTGNPEMNEELMDNLIFVNIPYFSADSALETQAEQQDNLLDSIPNLTSPEIQGGINETNQALLDFTNINDNYLNYVGAGNSAENTSFIKSEYGETVGVKTSKVFNDENGGYIVSGDLVKVNVTVKNISSSTLKDLAYIDRLDNIFFLVKNSVTIENTTAVEQTPPLGFDLLIDDFSLAPGQELKFSYYIKTLPIKHSYIQVGLFEEGEVGDDFYGDILLKESEENCFQNTKIYRSTAARAYLEGIKQPDCDSGKIKLPTELEKNSIDNNNNGIPDYIDVLTSNRAAQEAYAKTELNKANKDSDGDGIPDKEDNAPSFNNNDGNLLDNLDKINSLAYDVSEQLDSFIDGLGCGFGGGSCFSLPMNWAPLAPGSDPTILGYPVGDGLNVSEGFPVFSAITWEPGRYCTPSVWPSSVLGPGCALPGAGGRLGTWSPTNFLRFFITPTITGAVGEAICFGGPALTTGFGGTAIPWSGVGFGCVPPPGIGVLSDCIPTAIGGPFIPYGNCIVAAQPLNMCSSDGSDGDPGSVGEVQTASSGYGGNIVGNPAGNFGIINGNCSSEEQTKSTKIVDLAFVEDYINFKESGLAHTSTLVSKYNNVIKDLESASAGGNALINLDGGVAGNDMELSVEIDTDSLLSGDFSDAIKVKMERTWGFPDFLMSWVTRQIEEIKTKLTDWPTIYIVLPDFTGLFDGWDNFMGGLGDAYDFGKTERENEEERLQTTIDTLELEKSLLDCEGTNFGECLAIDTDIAKNELLQDGGISFIGIDKGVSSMRKGASGIESVYKFLSNTPLIDIKQEIVYINIPWIDRVDIERALLDWKLKLRQRENEVNKAGNDWSLGATCTQADPIEKQKCIDQNDLNSKVHLNANSLLSSLERNIEILESYKNFPKDLYKLIKTKEFYLEQIICNLDSIANLVGGRIGDNGTRFKAWVELYITIKAILKSWQLLIDIFLEYDAECHQCKNERYDSLYLQFKVISLLIPDIPVIQFPKWPDIIIDLHNIRVNLQIYLPEFKFNFRPIVLPQLPNLYLPSLPNVNINLPEMPLLPELTLPTLPELPSLPTVELPNLPPPPTLPELFSSLEAILEIIRLLVKILCILKSSPLVPEWRAGDQIAFITERQGYFSLDFLDISLPQFSFPFVDAVKVTSYVNLEFDNEFMVELARQALSPINSVTNNVANMFNVHFSDLDFSSYTPDDINIGLNETNIKNTIEKNAFALYASKGIMKLISYIDENKEVEVSSKEFISLVNKSLSSKAMVSNPKYDELRNLWTTVSEMTYSKEDKLIKQLQDTNTEKFDAVKDIIKNEIRLNKQLGNEVTNMSKDIIKKVSFENKSNIKEYNQSLEKYNAKFVKSAIDLVYGKDEKEMELEKQGNKLMAQLETGVSNLSKGLKPPKKLLAASPSVAAPTPAASSCQAQASSEYKYDYDGLYVLEGGRSYRLFDYIDILDGTEETTIIDFDQDGDEDLLYMVSGELYLKENLTKSKNKVYITDSPIVVKPAANKFYNGEVFYESVNYFDKMGTSNKFIDVSFNETTNKEIHNYRLEFYTIVDKWLNIGNSLYNPENIKKNVIDAFSDIENITLPMEETESLTIRKNLAYITHVGTVPGVDLTTKSLINIKTDLANDKKVNLSRGTKIYSSNDGSFSMSYTIGDDTEIKTKFIAKNQNIVFTDSIKVVAISGEAYIEGLEDIVLSGGNIGNYIGLPLLPGSNISADNELPRNASSHIDIRYYDNSEMIVDLQEISSYDLYDLGIKTDNYTVRVEKNNDFYYGKMRSFSEGIFSTYSRTILSSPQKESDLLAPENNIRSIEVPIFQEKEIDLTSYIYENGGIANIKDVYIDFDLDVDSSGDGKPTNDNDSELPIYMVDIDRNEVHVKLLFGPYDELINQKIGITIIDENDNVGYKEVSFKVTAPTLSINSYENNLIEGTVDNEFNSIPISFYRFRGGTILPLENKVGDTDTFSFDEGEFSFQLNDSTTGLTIEQNGVAVGTINENTGKITTALETKVYPSNSSTNDTLFPKIEIKKAGKVIFTQYIQLLTSPFINIVNDFTGLTVDDEEGIYVKLINKASYSYYKIPEGVLYNPGTLVIYKNSDITKKALFTIFKDGRINTLSDNHTLVYNTHGDYIKLILKDNANTVAEVLFHIDGGYVIK